jgi:D-alanine-D-alanine ligase-like ATP-grasp enzyme
MLDPTRSPRLLRALILWDRVAAKFRRKPSGREQAGRQLSAFYERVWREAAAAIGATVVDLGGDVLEIRLGERWTRVWQNCSAIDDLAAYRVVRTKAVMYRLLASHGIPVPRHLEFTLADLTPAAAFLEGTEQPCVVKPACGTGGGLAVVTGLRTRWQLARAAWAASVWGDHPVIEEQVEGTNYRLLYLDGELLDVVKREPPSVVADGTSTVLQLVERLNQERLAQRGVVSHVQLGPDLDMQTTLARQGLSLRSVPPKGTRVQLKTVINENSSLENVTARDDLCADILNEAALAAQVSGLRLAGVDVLTADPGRSLRDGGGVILEVNTPPGYFWHYHKRDGSFPVALHVLRALFHLTGEPHRNGPPAGILPGPAR